MSGVGFAAGVAVVALLGFFYLNRKIDRRLQASELVKKIHEEVDSILIELNSTTERNIGLVEERIKALGDLLDQADRKIGVFKREMDKQTRSADIYTNVLRKQQQRFQRERPQSGAEGEAGASGGAPVETVESGPKLREQVRNLRDQGYSPPKIAATLGSTLGEVELVLSLLEEKG